MPEVHPLQPDEGGGPVPKTFEPCSEKEQKVGLPGNANQGKEPKANIVYMRADGVVVDQEIDSRETLSVKTKAQDFKKVNLVLDSGSNEFCLKDVGLSIKKLRDVSIGTAKKNSEEKRIEKALYGTVKDLVLPSLRSIGRQSKRSLLGATPRQSCLCR